MYQPLFPYLTPTQEGLVLGNTIITKRKINGTLAIAGYEEQTLALLSIAYGKLVSQNVLSQLWAASKAYSQTPLHEWPSLSDPDYYPPHVPDRDANAPSAKSRTLTHLALAGLNKAENIGEIAPHLAEAKKMLAAGMQPMALLKAIVLLSDNEMIAWKDSAAKYNPNHDPTNGQFTSGPDSSDDSQEFNLNAALAHLNSKAGTKSTGNCAKFVHQALAAGGLDVASPPQHSDGNVYAKDFGPSLTDAGFDNVGSANDGQGYPPSGYVAQAGDVVVIQNYPGGNPAGHMAMYNGEQWVSDFWQTQTPKDSQAFWPGSGYRSFQPSYTIYRYK